MQLFCLQLEASCLQWGFFTYNWHFTFHLQLELFACILTFLLTIGASFAYSGKLRPIRALRDCKQRSSTVSKKTPTVSKQASPFMLCLTASICSNVSEIFCWIDFWGFAGFSPGGCFWALWYHRKESKLVANIREKSGGSTIKIGGESLLPKTSRKSVSVMAIHLNSGRISICNESFCANITADLSP